MASVNKPTDVKVKEADVNRKLQMYGIVTAFQQGKVPSVCTFLYPSHSLPILNCR
jgi:hypothetical protein